MGKCPECGQWNTFKEFKEAKGANRKSQNPSTSLRTMQDASPELLSKVQQSPQERIATDFVEMDSVLGGGIVLGSATLVAGDPGIGKSTLLLQLCLNLSKRGKKVLYVSAEESREQVAMRATRLRAQIPNPKSQETNKEENLLLLSITDTDAIGQTILDTNPDFVVVDSIQTVESENAGGLSGSVGQVRYAAQQLIRLAKQSKTICLL
jgi:DNA repair protein RadA/Sms